MAILSHFSISSPLLSSSPPKNVLSLPCSPPAPPSLRRLQCGLSLYAKWHVNNNDDDNQRWGGGAHGPGCARRWKKTAASADDKDVDDDNGAAALGTTKAGNGEKGEEGEGKQARWDLAGGQPHDSQ